MSDLTNDMALTIRDLMDGRNAEQIAEDTGLPLPRCYEMVSMSNWCQDGLETVKMVVTTGRYREELIKFFSDSVNQVNVIDPDNILVVWIDSPDRLARRVKATMDKMIDTFEVEVLHTGE